jgi:hypothetical protein
MLKNKAFGPKQIKAASKINSTFDIECLNVGYFPDRMQTI